MDKTTLEIIGGAIVATLLFGGRVLSFLNKFFDVSKSRHEANKAKAEAEKARIEAEKAKSEVAKNEAPTPIAIVELPEGNHEPILKYENISGQYMFFHGRRYNAQVANIRNVQTRVKNAASATASIEYIADSGLEKYITKESVWFNVKGEDVVEQENLGVISGNQVRSIPIVLIDDDKRVMMPTGIGNPPVREFGIGHWTAKLSITSGNCNRLEGDIGFTILEDRVFIFDRPAFTLRHRSRGVR